MKTLVIAEKPSVATDLAKVLGNIKKNGDFYENENYVISSAVGHLVELFMPEDIDAKLKRWTLSSLPIIPETFQLKPIERNKKKFNDLKRLLKRKDIDLVINACDAGREGELIFSYLYDLSKCKIPYKRLWLTSMTKESILEAFDNLRSSEQMQSLKEAAMCRSQSDWLIGINGTRAITSRMMGQRAKAVASVGRVQTPTLAMIVDRDRTIRNFQPRQFWKIIGTFSVENGQYQGTYQKANWKKNADESDKIDTIWQEQDAQEILDQIKSFDKANIEETKKRTSQIAPKLYDLTSLQREANKKFGFSATTTLSIAQALYERHKLLTYPRTDARALPEDYENVCKKTLSAHMISGQANIQNLSSYGSFANKILQNNWINPKNKRVFDNKQVSDHFAIIPTENTNYGKLKPEEEKIYDMVMKRFLCVFFPAAQFDVTTRMSILGEHKFKTEGKVLAFAGWQEVYGKDASFDDDAKKSTKSSNKAETILPALTDNDKNLANVDDLNLSKDQTKPPAHFSEATLLSAMESAGKLVEDEELAEAMKEKGLGTPATRAQIIETLIAHRYVEREKKELLATAKAEGIIDFLSTVGAETLTSPAMTGQWEYKLRQIEYTELSKDEFMQGINDLTKTFIEAVKAFNEENTQTTPTDIPSPNGKGNLLETFRAYKSEDGEVLIYKTIGNRQITPEEIKLLVTNRRIGPLEGFKSKLGRPYVATLYLDEAHKVKFEFANSTNETPEEIEKRKKEQLEALKDAKVICDCPNISKKTCKAGKLKELENAYVCDNPECKFRINKTILQHKMTTEEVLKMCNEGKTGLITDFVSNKTKKKFSAMLYPDRYGNIKFAFEPRKPKEKAASGDKVAKKVAKKIVSKKDDSSAQNSSKEDNIPF